MGAESVERPTFRCRIFHKKNHRITSFENGKKRVYCLECDKAWWEDVTVSETSAFHCLITSADSDDPAVMFPVFGQKSRATFEGFKGGVSGGAGAGGGWDEEKTQDVLIDEAKEAAIIAQTETEGDTASVQNDGDTEETAGESKTETGSDEDTDCGDGDQIS